MQAELNAADTTRTIRILGVNAAGLESGNPTIVQGRSIPWLQDSTAVNAWGQWNVTWRDVIILDRENHRFAVYNLTAHDLQVAANYDSLKTLLLQAAAE